MSHCSKNSSYIILYSSNSSTHTHWSHLEAESLNKYCYIWLFQLCDSYWTAPSGKVRVGKYFLILFPFISSPNSTACNGPSFFKLQFSCLTVWPNQNSNPKQYSTTIIMRLLPCCVLTGRHVLYPVSPQHVLSWEPLQHVDLLQSDAKMRQDTVCDREGNGEGAGTSPCGTSHYLGHLVDNGIIIYLHWATELSGWQAKWLGRWRGRITMFSNVALKWDSMEFNSMFRTHGESRLMVTVDSYRG